LESTITPGAMPPAGRAGPASLRARTRSGRWSIVAFSVGVTIALLVVGLPLVPRPATGPPAPPPGWETFSQAVARVSPLVQGWSGGPWTMALAEGVAATGAWAPTLSMWTLNSTALVLQCQSYLRGFSVFTFWNGSNYPATPPPVGLRSGGAGLWTFAYGNASGATGIVSVFRGATVGNGFVPLESPCYSNYGPFGLVKGKINPGNVSDTPALAGPAFDALAPSLNLNSSAAVEYLILGAPAVPFARFQGPLWQTVWNVGFGTCGLPGVKGVTSIFGGPTPGPLPGWTSTWTIGGPCFGAV